MRLAGALAILAVATAAGCADGNGEDSDSALATTPPTVAIGPSSDRCDVAAAIREGHPRIARNQLRKALDEPATRECAVRELNELATETKKAQDAKDNDDSRLRLDEVWTELKDFFLGSAWPWLAALFLAWALWWVYRLLWPSKRISVRAAKSKSGLAERVSAAAAAAGGQGPGPVKMIPGNAEALPEKMVTDLSKLLKVPGAAQLSALVGALSWLPRPSSRLFVHSATAGGWAVVQLDLRRSRPLSRKARIALPIGDLKEAQIEELLALVAAAWLIEQVHDPDEAPPVIRLSAKQDTAVFHACFRAGANRQARGEIELARACYAAMPADVAKEDAPFSWTGARLNEMMALNGEERWDEARSMAKAVEGVPEQLLKADDTHPYCKDDLETLRRRKLYLVAITLVERFHVAPSQATRREAERAVEAMLEAQEARDAPDHPEKKHVDRTLSEAEKMVELCFRIAKGDTTVTLGDVLARLASGGRDPKLPRPLLGAAVYYDAACAVGMLLERLEGQSPREATRDRSALVRQHVTEGLRLLTIALRATPLANRKRVRASAKLDPMLASLRKADLDDFEEAIGKDDPATEDSKESVSAAV